MTHRYITLSKWILNPHKNYFHLFSNCLIHILTYMKKYTLSKKETYLVISSPINKNAYPFFKEVLTVFVNIIEPNKMIKPVIIDINKYCDRHILCDILYDLSLKIQLPIKVNKKIVYIKRKGKRYILNDNSCIEVLKTLYKDNYDIVISSFEDVSFKQQVDIMNGCVLLTGCHGAGFTNTYFMDSGSILFELFPESFYTDCFKIICDEKSINYFYMNGKSSKPPQVTLEDYKKNINSPKFNNIRLRSSIRDITFTIDIDIFTSKISSILPV